MYRLLAAIAGAGLLVGLGVAAAQPPMAELLLGLKDPSGAGIEASGRLTNVATGAERRFQTESDGTYVFRSLPFGRYRLEASKAGFAGISAVLELRSATPLTRTFVMSLGSAAARVEVVGTAPLPGVDRPLEEVASPVQAASGRDIEASGATDLSDFLNRRMTSVFWNEIQGNPFQADLNYRGFTASPLLGTPQGLSVYLDGVRQNQPFGDVVSWDLIPSIAISEVSLMPGSNPLFGLNTLGGALSIWTKDGRSHAGTALQLSGGSFGRRNAEIEHGGSHSKGWHWYGATDLFFEDGWRADSPSNVRQFFGKLGKQGDATALALSLGYANNSLIGNGLQEQRFLERDYSSIYTKPDLTAHRAPFLNLQLRHSPSSTLTFSANAYFRYVRTRTLNGDTNEEALDQSVYQPNAAERAALAAAGYTGFPTAGENAANTPFPFWRCIANALLRDEPSEKCNGLLNRSSTHQRNYGLSGLVSWFTSGGDHRNQLTAGGGYDGNGVGFSQSSELGYINPDRSITGVRAFGDGVTGGDQDGEPYDTRVELAGRIRTSSFFATDTFSAGNRFHLTVSGRYNRTTVDNRDQFQPLEGTGSLTGKHVFQRLNPAAGVTFRPVSTLNAYVGYTEGNRAPTSIELGCADPNTPCKLPNAMASDPPLKQVVTRTIEAGLRSGGEGNFGWNVGWFRAQNRDDLLFVASEQTGFGYFKNLDKTLREGLEAGFRARLWRAAIGGGYTMLSATFQSGEEVNGAGNSTNSEALEGVPGTEGLIEIEPGNRIPLIPKHMFKAYASVPVTTKLAVDANVMAFSSSYARGNENNQHSPDGRYYLGPGETPGYAVVHLAARYQVHRRVELFMQVNNLLDRRYYSAGQLGATAFTETGSFVARPFPAIGGEFPVRQGTFYAPGAPRGAWGGLRFKF